MFPFKSYAHERTCIEQAQRNLRCGEDMDSTYYYLMLGGMSPECARQAVHAAVVGDSELFHKFYG